MRSILTATNPIHHTMKRNEHVNKIMSIHLVTVHHGDPVSKVRHLMKDQGMHHVPVVSGRKLVGMISFSDILRVSFGDASTDERSLDATLDHTVTLEQIMTKDVVSLEETATVREAAEILGQGKFHSLPIVRDGDLVGMVTTTDLIRYLSEQL